MQTQDYLSAFDAWLSQHIHAAVKSGKDLAYKDRRLNCGLKLDEDGSAWDYLMLDPGALPPPGHAWTVYRLHGVHPMVRPEPADAPGRGRKRRLIEGLAETLFGAGRTAPTLARRAQPALRVVS